ncbi:MAG TPA: hypothetical protein VHA75_00750 [Rugosimonospora sp.]|uniref:hypothetical protein n=1 Tax=Actinomadura sp. TaxID=1989 RepID=UPI002C83716F|nr:hypothetical protein [Rugosimonospora sp.]
MKLSSVNSARKTCLSGECGSTSTSRPATSRPYTTRFARPQRSASPASSEANAPTALPTTDSRMK